MVLKLSRAQAGKALNELHEYGLLGRRKLFYEVSHTLIHTYVSSVLVPRMDQQLHQQMSERLLQVLERRLSEQGEGWGEKESLLMHIQACAEEVDQPAFLTSEAASFFARAGYTLLGQVRYTEAELLLQRALEVYERVLGAGHIHIARVLSSLARLYQSQGKYAEAEPLYLRASEINERMLGARHPDTALSLNNLATLYDRQGKYEQAEPLYQRALRIWVRVLGIEHPDTAQSLKNLAAFYRKQGKYEQAELLLQQKRNYLNISKEISQVAPISTAFSQDQRVMAHSSRRTLQTIWERDLEQEHPDPCFERMLHNF